MSATTDVAPLTESEAPPFIGPLTEAATLAKEAYSLVCASTYGSLMVRDFLRLEQLREMGVTIPEPPHGRLA